MLRVAASLALLGLSGCVLDSTLDPSGTGGHGGAGNGGSTTSFNTGGGATTTTTGSGFGGQGGEGGAPPEICGDGIVVGAEQCDDANDVPLDGCDNCVYAPYATCPEASAKPIVVPVARGPGASLSLSGTTSGANNDLPYSNGPIPNFNCDSQGDDVVFAVKAAAAGSLTIELRTMDGDFGGNGDKGRLHLRTDCPTGLDSAAKIQASLAGELACFETQSGNPFGKATTTKWMDVNETLYIVVGGAGGNDHGAFALDLRLTKCGDGVVQNLEDCDGGPTCSGCLLPTSCGAALTNASARKFAAGHCYALVPSAGNYYEARRACVAGGGDLVSAETAGERGGLPAMPAKTWLGLEDLDHDGVWRWLTGAATPPTAAWPAGLWVVGQPSGAASEPDCAYFDGGGAMLGTVTHHCGDDEDALLCEPLAREPLTRVA